MMWEEFARRMEDNYSLFLFALTGRYQQLRSAGTMITPRVIKDLEIAAHKLAQTFYAVANAEIDLFMSAMQEDASESLLSEFASRRLVFMAYLRGILAENVHQTSHMAKVGTDGLSKMIQAHGAMGLLIQRNAGVIKFLAHDSINRNWDSKKLVRFLARDFAYQTCLDYAFEKECDASETGLIISNKGFVMALGSMDGYTSFADARATVFHPNSTATFTSYVPT